MEWWVVVVFFHARDAPLSYLFPGILPVSGSKLLHFGDGDKTIHSWNFYTDFTVCLIICILLVCGWVCLFIKVQIHSVYICMYIYILLISTCNDCHDARSPVTVVVNLQYVCWLCFWQEQTALPSDLNCGCEIVWMWRHGVCVSVWCMYKTPWTQRQLFSLIPTSCQRKELFLCGDIASRRTGPCGHTAWVRVDPTGSPSR